MAIPAPKKMVRAKGRKRRKVRSARALPPPGGIGGPRPIGERPNAGKRPVKPSVPRSVQKLHPQMETWVSEAFTAMGAPELVGKIPWNWNSGMTRVMGRAHYTWNGERATPTKMDFSPSLFKKAEEEQMRQTVYHECAHIVDYHKGTYVKGKPHGPSWKRIMIRAGVPPKRCHNVEVTKRRKSKKYPAKCGCKTHMVGKKRRDTMLRGGRYRCKLCGQGLVLVR